MIIIIFLIIILLAIIILYHLYYFHIENFNPNPGSYLSIVDPFSLYLFQDISAKEDWWNVTHQRKLYYYRDYVPQYYKD